MDYHVILIECGKPTHHWFYQYHFEAIEQLHRLIKAYEEVNEVSVTIVKAGHADRSSSVYELLQSQIIYPDHYDLD